MMGQKLVSLAIGMVALVFFSPATCSLVCASVQFTRITSGPIWDDVNCSHGVAWVDYNNDGYLDLYLGNWFYDISHTNALNLNDGQGGFTKVTSGDIATDIQTSSAAWADYDNDGDVDCFACNPATQQAWRQNAMYENNGDGTFTKLNSGSVVTDYAMTPDAVWGDFDNDGDVDLFASNHCWPPCLSGGGPLFYRNDGDSLAHVDHALLGFPEGDNANPAACDYDQDGDLDLVYRRNELRNLFFTNDADGTFTENSTTAFAAEYSIGFSWADYDNDGDFDILLTSGNDCRLYNNNHGTFSRIPTQSFNPGTATWIGAGWGDCDNDGDLDVFATSFAGYYEPRPNALMENNGDGTFTKITTGPVATDVEPSAGTAWADYDRDGDLDLLVANENYYHNALYRNDGNSNGWITVICSGSQSNRSGIGAKVKVAATIGGQLVHQLREISSQSGTYSQAPLEAHFGLGDAAVIDTLIVEWPSRIVDAWLSVTPCQLLTVTEGSSDIDGDGVSALTDNCPFTPNPSQRDLNANGVGDACEFRCGDANGDAA
ncbi:MAG: CRTAC1 family protein, partial [Candidatus Zixiibacteriota bacterium]